MAKKRHDAPQGYIDMYLPVKMAARITQLVDEYNLATKLQEEADARGEEFECHPAVFAQEIGNLVVSSWHLAKEATGLVMPPPPAKKKG